MSKRAPKALGGVGSEGDGGASLGEKVPAAVCYKVAEAGDDDTMYWIADFGKSVLAEVWAEKWWWDRTRLMPRHAGRGGEGE